MIGIFNLSDYCLQANYLASVLLHIRLKFVVQDVQRSGSISLLFVVFYAFFQFPVELTNADPCPLYFPFVLFVRYNQIIHLILQLSVGHFNNIKPILQLKGLFALSMKLFIKIISFRFHPANLDLEIVEIILPLIDLLVISS